MAGYGKALKGDLLPISDAGLALRDPDLFFQKVEECHRYDLEKKFYREAVSWELWQVIKGTRLRKVFGV